MEYQKMSSYRDVYGVLGLAAMPEPKDLNFELIQQFKKKLKMASYNGNSNLINPELASDEDAYEFIYERLWAATYEAVV